MSKLRKKPSVLNRGHPTLQNMNFYKLLSTFVGHFCPPGSGSTDPIEYGYNPDPDPQPWLNLRISVVDPVETGMFWKGRIWIRKITVPDLDLNSF